MKTLFLIILVLILLAGILVFSNDFYVKRKLRNLISAKYKVVRPLKKKLDAQQSIAQDEILSLVKAPSFRHVVFQLLAAHKKLDLFPAEYCTPEKSAESFMVTWLEFPTELGRAPDDIELMTKVILEERLEYYVFKYRSSTPQWAAKMNWMIGVVGPYTERIEPFELPDRIFSRFNTIDSISPEQEVKWVHENIHQR